jgi:hypothetical protein
MQSDPDLSFDDLRAVSYILRLMAGETSAEIAEHEGIHKNNTSRHIKSSVDRHGAERIRSLTRLPRIVPIYPLG